MKKILYIFFLMLSTLHFAQGTANPFEESEKEKSAFESRATSGNHGQMSNDPYGDSGGGNPNTPAPIDDYIPLLVITALGIIIYTTRKKRNLLS